MFVFYRKFLVFVVVGVWDKCSVVVCYIYLVVILGEVVEKDKVWDGRCWFR